MCMYSLMYKVVCLWLCTVCVPGIYFLAGPSIHIYILNLFLSFYL